MKQYSSSEVFKVPIAPGIAYERLDLGVVSFTDCIALEVRRSFTAKEVIKVLKQVIRQFGALDFIRCDNGPELVAKAIQEWLRSHQINTVYIEPGSPWQNPFVESFHSRFRDGCLNREWFINLLDAKACVAEFRKTYNTVRPHSGIEYKSPAEIYFSQANLYQC